MLHTCSHSVREGLIQETGSASAVPSPPRCPVWLAPACVSASIPNPPPPGTRSCSQSRGEPPPRWQGCSSIADKGSRLSRPGTRPDPTPTGPRQVAEVSETCVLRIYRLFSRGAVTKKYPAHKKSNRVHVRSTVQCQAAASGAAARPGPALPGCQFFRDWKCRLLRELSRLLKAVSKNVFKHSAK